MVQENNNDFYQKLIDFIDNGEKNEKEVTKLKRNFKLTVQDKRKNDTLSERRLDIAVKLLLANYEELKNFNGINEILLEIIDNYKYLNEKNDPTDTMIDEKIKNIYIEILGNPGTNSKGMDYDYLEEIIKGKMTDSDEVLINRYDVLNILKEQAKEGFCYNFDAYQKLINDVMISCIDKDIYSIRNPKVVYVLADLANSYKVQGKPEESKNVYLKALELYKLTGCANEELKSELEHNAEMEGNLSEKLNKVIDNVEVNTNPNQSITEKFLNIDVNSVDDLVQKLKGEEVTTLQTKKIIPGEHERKKKGIKLKEHNRTGNNYIMPANEKHEGIKKAIKKLGLTIESVRKFKELNKENDNELLRALQDKIEDYKDYVLIGIKEGNISLLECYSDTQKHIQIIQNENIHEILQFEKLRDQINGGSVPKQHRKKSFAENLTKEIADALEKRKQGLEITDKLPKATRKKKDDNIKEEKRTRRPKQVKPKQVKSKKSIGKVSLGELQVEADQIKEEIEIKKNELFENIGNKEMLKQKKTELKALFDRMQEIQNQLENMK